MALEESGCGFDTVVLVGFAAFVGYDGYVIATVVAFGVEVVDEFVHCEESFDVVGYVVTVEVEVFVEVVEP